MENLEHYKQHCCILSSIACKENLVISNTDVFCNQLPLRRTLNIISNTVVFCNQLPVRRALL